jgi:hypothetical protein
MADFVSNAGAVVRVPGFARSSRVVRAGEGVDALGNVE